MDLLSYVLSLFIMDLLMLDILSGVFICEALIAHTQMLLLFIRSD